MSQVDSLIASATAGFEAGFTSKASQKRALDDLNRAFNILTDGARSDMRTAGNDRFPNACTENDLNSRHAFINSLGYWELPDGPHQLRAKHEPMLGDSWNTALVIRDLRNAIKAAPVVKIERKTNEREVAIQKSIRDIMTMRRSQFERGLHVAELFGGLPVWVNVHQVTNEHGTTFLRAFYYLRGELTPLNIIVCIAQELERHNKAA